MFRLSQRQVEQAYRRAGLVEIETRTIGFFPPQLLNRFSAVRRLEVLLEGQRLEAREVPIEITIGAWSDTLLVPRGEDRFREPAVLVPQGVVDSAIDGQLLVRVEGVSRKLNGW